MSSASAGEHPAARAPHALLQLMLLLLLLLLLLLGEKTETDKPETKRDTICADGMGAHRRLQGPPPSKGFPEELGAAAAEAAEAAAEAAEATEAVTPKSCVGAAAWERKPLGSPQLLLLLRCCSSCCCCVASDSEGYTSQPSEGAPGAPAHPLGRAAAEGGPSGPHSSP